MKTNNLMNLFRKKGSALIIVGLLLVVIIILFAYFNTLNTRIDAKSSELMKIETPYGCIEYPKAYEKYLLLDEQEENGCYSMTFCSSIFEKESTLFTVYFNALEKGEPIGFIKVQEKEIPVSIEVNQEPVNESVPEKDRDIYFNMLDGVNCVVASITALETYSRD